MKMAEKLGLGGETRELKLGASFTNPRSTAFHTVRYDFKPASVDVNKSATIDVGSSNQITVNVPHLDGAGTSQTVFKGSQKPYQKECVLIIDKNTGKITLERLTSNIQVKKTRSEALHKPLPPHLADKLEPNTNSSSSTSSKMSSKLPGGNKSRKERQNIPVSKHSPRHSASSHSPASYHSPARSRSPVKREPVSLPPPSLAAKSASASPVAPPSLAASLPLIGMDDFPMGMGNNKPVERMEKMSSYSKTPYKTNAPPPEATGNKGKAGAGAGALSDSSSSSSSSSEDSESDNDVNTKSLVTNFSSLNSDIKGIKRTKSMIHAKPIVPVRKSIGYHDLQSLVTKFSSLCSDMKDTKRRKTMIRAKPMDPIPESIDDHDVPEPVSDDPIPSTSFSNPTFYPSCPYPSSPVSDSSDSDSDDDDGYRVPAKKVSMPPTMTNPIDHVLNEDLCLSESGSESD